MNNAVLKLHKNNQKLSSQDPFNVQRPIKWLWQACTVLYFRAPGAELLSADTDWPRSSPFPDGSFISLKIHILLGKWAWENTYRMEMECPLMEENLSSRSMNGLVFTWKSSSASLHDIHKCIINIDISFVKIKKKKQKRTEDFFYFGWVEVIVALGIWWSGLCIPLWFLFTCLWQCLKTFSFFDCTGTRARGRACAHTPSNIGMCGCSLLAHTNTYTRVSVVGAAKC